MCYKSALLQVETKEIVKERGCVVNQACVITVSTANTTIPYRENGESITFTYVPSTMYIHVYATSAQPNGFCLWFSICIIY